MFIDNTLSIGLLINYFILFTLSIDRSPDISNNCHHCFKTIMETTNTPTPDTKQSIKATVKSPPKKTTAKKAAKKSTTKKVPSKSSLPPSSTTKRSRKSVKLYAEISLGTLKQLFDDDDNATIIVSRNFVLDKKRENINRQAEQELGI